jgi:hypothetical protein
MRTLLVLLGCTALAACGAGAGPTSPGGVAVTPGSGSNANADPGTGTGVSFASNYDTNTTATSGSSSTFLSISSSKSFDGMGGLQSLSIDQSTKAQLYSGNASTAITPSGTVAYDPRSGIFTLTLADTKANVSDTFNYQDPAHRTSDAQLASQGVPAIAGFNYLESVGSGTNDLNVFFYQRPGDSTTYVTLAGYVRNSVPDGGTSLFERGALVFGSRTALSEVPTSGTGTYTGGFLASMALGSEYQWLAGNSNLSVDFGKNSVSLGLNGTVGDAFSAITGAPATGLPGGTTFSANGTATLSSGSFTGQFQNASFTSGGTTVPIDFSSVSPGSSTAGASSIDGAFFGPKAVNVGGSFRIVGGVPNQRIDILGSFTGAKK